MYIRKTGDASGYIGTEATRRGKLQCTYQGKAELRRQSEATKHKKTRTIGHGKGLANRPARSKTESEAGARRYPNAPTWAASDATL